MCKNKGFAAILGLLVVIAIAMMIYFLDIRAIFGPSQQYANRPTQEEDRPWLMEEMLIAADKNVPPPHRGQPELLAIVNLQGVVERNNAPRGRIALTFSRDCRILADWSAQYNTENKMYSIHSLMKGNIVPDKAYSGDNGSDPTRLYFFAKGAYAQTTQLSDKTSQTENGIAYIMGWLRPDYTAEGTITITTDQSWSALYPFSATISKASKN
jgi:hypothetical protein